MPDTSRSTALRSLIEWQRGRAFADDILDDTTRNLPDRDRAWTREAFYGILRNLNAVDFLLERLRDGTLDERVRAVLRLGLYQLFFMRTSPHAAVNETVSLGGKARGLVNAILRRALREKEQLDAALAAASESVRLSHPDFLLARWRKNFGPDAALAIAEWNNKPAELFIRVNALRISPAELIASTPDADATPTAHPLVLRVKRLPAEWLSRGLCYVQDPSTLLACDLLAPIEGEFILDACAAPGGKTTYLAQIIRDHGHIVACDLHDSRIARLRENIRNLGVRSAQAVKCDMMRDLPKTPPRELTTAFAKSFDRILIDAPCTNTGVIRRRIDVRWRLTEEDFLRMPPQQLALIRRCAGLLKSGGTLVYSTCSLEPEENDAVVEQAVATIPGLRFIESRRTLPFVDGTDGSFAAKFVRR